MTKVPELAEGDRITRYINEKGKLRREGAAAGYNAFMPPRNLRLSVYHTETLDEPEVEQIADDFVSTPDRPVLAKADLAVRIYSSAGLRIEIDGVPHPRHGNALGWSGQHALQKVVALQLAEAATVSPISADDRGGHAEANA